MTSLDSGNLPNRKDHGYQHLLKAMKQKEKQIHKQTNKNIMNGNLKVLCCGKRDALECLGTGTTETCKTLKFSSLTSAHCLV